MGKSTSGRRVRVDFKSLSKVKAHGAVVRLEAGERLQHLTGNRDS